MTSSIYYANACAYYTAKLMLFFPWYDQYVDLLGSYATYKEHYHTYNIITIHYIQPCTCQRGQVYTETDIDNILGLRGTPPANGLNRYIISMSSATASSFTRKGEGLHFHYQSDKLLKNINFTHALTRWIVPLKYSTVV